MARRNDSVEAVLAVLERRGWMRAAALCEALGLSQPTLSRRLRRAGAAVLRSGAGPRTRYAARRGYAGAGSAQPLYAVDEAGRVTHLATLHGVAPNGFYLEAGDQSAWLLGEDGRGAYDDLPYFLQDLRPQGFLGREIGRWLADRFAWPGDPRQWDADTVARFLLSYGDDVPGNLLLGDEALARFERRRPSPVAARARDYPALVERILGEGEPGSSAGGEQPKFAAFVPDIGHVLVKFSPAGDSSEVRRWQDLLVAEWHALECLRAHDLAAATARLYDIDGRIYLEVERFDRVGSRGRRPNLSLEAVDAEFVGSRRSWTESAQQLHEAGWLDSDSLERIRWLDLFGAWIENSDRHLGNLSLMPADDGFVLHPVYDMLPMALAPVRGEIREPAFRMPVASRLGDGMSLWQATGKAAEAYWQALADEPRLSESFRALAQDRARQIHGLLQGNG
ncbi:type II toxin-antitoxin system HipA family toxin YjjJ [Natronospira bacteriovora]|uniref:Type II toxin-antitoxin system HipA family toxin YjjJ n=1 Tax=Natronospira bacteriovora TaxID=3069753 RepID=A0ABU0W4P5_9GAMM|nr:type II toxin-antitoxin system HipA family toxin YjjJ [Natronospira sp. AB-CW4]MDQ2068997.1 type II toxin-antitoxin system HipA family toxin YjjJ [Natronospira sp. AB-CW4]